MALQSRAVQAGPVQKIYRIVRNQSHPFPLGLQTHHIAQVQQEVPIVLFQLGSEAVGQILACGIQHLTAAQGGQVLGAGRYPS